MRGNWQLAFHEVLASEVVAARSMSMGETAHRVGRLNSQLPTMVRSRSFVFCCLVPGPVHGLAVRGLGWLMATQEAIKLPAISSGPIAEA